MFIFLTLSCLVFRVQPSLVIKPCTPSRYPVMVTSCEVTCLLTAASFPITGLFLVCLFSRVLPVTFLGEDLQSKNIGDAGSLPTNL